MRAGVGGSEYPRNSRLRRPDCAGTGDHRNSRKGVQPPVHRPGVGRALVRTPREGGQRGKCNVTDLYCFDPRNVRYPRVDSAVGRRGPGGSDEYAALRGADQAQDVHRQGRFHGGNNAAFQPRRVGAPPPHTSDHRDAGGVRVERKRPRLDGQSDDRNLHVLPLHRPPDEAVHGDSHNALQSQNQQHSHGRGDGRLCVETSGDAAHARDLSRCVKNKAATLKWTLAVLRAANTTAANVWAQCHHLVCMLRADGTNGTNSANIHASDSHIAAIRAAKVAILDSAKRTKFKHTVCPADVHRVSTRTTKAFTETLQFLKEAHALALLAQWQRGNEVELQVVTLHKPSHHTVLQFRHTVLASRGIFFSVETRLLALCHLSAAGETTASVVAPRIAITEMRVGIYVESVISTLCEETLPGAIEVIKLIIDKHWDLDALVGRCVRCVVKICAHCRVDPGTKTGCYTQNLVPNFEELGDHGVQSRALLSRIAGGNSKVSSAQFLDGLAKLVATGDGQLVECCVTACSQASKCPIENGMLLLTGKLLTPHNNNNNKHETELWIRSVFHPLTTPRFLTAISDAVDSRLLEMDESYTQRIRSLSPVYSLCTRQPLSPPPLQRTISSDFDAALLAAELNTFNGYAINS